MRLTTIKTVIFTFALTALLAGCSSCNTCGNQCATAPVGNVESLQQLQCLTGSKPGSGGSGISSIRLQALQETAMSIGAQGGLAWRAKQINCTLDRNSQNLDEVFDFNLMLLPHNILPPVLVEGRGLLDLDDNQTIRISDRTYQILSQARFVTTAPNWRDYLWQSYETPQIPFGSLLPQNCAEKEVWKTYSALGWAQGITQANQIYGTSLNRLKRDFTGMIRYRVLLSQNMVSAPFVSHVDLGITGSCSDMRINDQVLRITALPCLQTNSRCWHPNPVCGDQSCGDQ